MANAKREENYEAVSLAVADNVNLETRMLLCDPILDYLEIDLLIVANETPFDVIPKEDQNYEYVQLASDESNLLAKPLKVDASSGRLLIDVILV